MVSSEFRLEARKKLEGKWGKAACIILAYVVIMFVIGFISGLLPETIESIVSIAVAIIEVPLGFGLIISLFKLYNDEEVKAFDFLGLGFNNFKKSWGISFQIIKKMILPTILIVVSYVLIAFGMIGMIGSSLYSSSSVGLGSFGFLGIIGFILLIVSMIWAITKSYYYQLAYIVVADNPEMTSRDAILKSEELMTNKRGKLFCLQLSFIGWGFLAAFTLGIAYLWLLPYMQFSIIAFYKFINGNNSNTESSVSSDNTSDNNPISE